MLPALIVIVGVLLHVQICDSEADLACRTTQYVELNKSGIVNCNFHEGNFGVFWYNSTEYTNSRPITYFQYSEKGGRGYTSGEFDMYPNGSLLINTVTMQHDHIFTVIMFETSTDAPTPIFIQVVVSVKPPESHPKISSCGHERICVYQVGQNIDIQCTVSKARPAAKLLWLLRSLKSDRNVSFETSVVEGTMTYSTTIRTTHTFLFPNTFAVLICKEASSHQLLKERESWILLDSSFRNLSTITPFMKYIEIDSKMELICSENNMLYLAWEKKNPDNSFRNLIYSLPGEQWSTKINSNKYYLEANGSLIVYEASLEDEGIYACFYGDGIAGRQTVFEVLVYVPPTPAYPVVHGCSHVQYCVLSIDRKGVLTCSLKRIRPRVELQWSIISKETANEITLSDKETSVIERGGTFDIIMTTKFYINHDAHARITVACQVIAVGVASFDLSTTVDLLFISDHILATPSEKAHSVENGLGLPGAIGITIAVIFLLFLMVIFGSFVFLRVRYEARNIKTDDQPKEEKESLMMQPKSIDKEVSKEQLFKEQLRQTYRRHCESFQPVPYQTSKVYHIDHLFVDGGMEVLSTKSKERDVLYKMKSFRDILRDLNEKLVIVEGDPGYGKTMLSLRLAYDWCCRPNDHAGIFILLKMRNLGGIKSFYSAIKKFLLPYDSILSTEDVASIISRSSSVVVVFDSFDKFPDASSFGDTFIKLILTKQVLANSTVILTTRPSSLPSGIPVTAKIIRLTGFTKYHQNEYMQNIITEKCILQRKRLGDLLHLNPIIDAICHVPLFFTLFVHIFLEGSQTEKHDYPTMTSFFQDVVKYFDSYWSDEPKGEAKFEDQTCKLQEMAFDGLSRDHRKIFWSKEEFVKNLGYKFYNHCLGVGIFFEEDVKVPTSVTPPQDPHKFTTLVRFYHNTFCEWFAACHLARLAEKLNAEDLKKELKNIKPINLQYLYRFACGLNKTTAENIIGHLEDSKDGQKFAILCILEQQKLGNKIISTVENLCKSPVNISCHDGKLFHVSMLQLLKIASANQIPVKVVWLTNMESFFKASKGLVLKSDLTLENVDTLLQLSIVDVGRIFVVEDFSGMLKYAASCSQLNTLRFRACILPEFVDSSDIPEEFGSRKIAVEWNPLQDDIWFRLDIATGHWEDIKQKRVMERRQYSQIVASVEGLKKMHSASSPEVKKSPKITSDLSEFLALETTDDSEDIVRRHCLSPINIHDSQGVKAQRSLVELLTFASECKIHIECVWLVGLDSIFTNNCLRFASGVVLPTLRTLKQLSIVDPERTFSEDDLIGILHYALKCPTLNFLRFRDCLPPQKIDLTHIEDDLRNKNLLVEWSFTSKMKSACSLNFQRGTWELENEELSNEKYNQIERQFRDQGGTTSS